MKTEKVVCVAGSLEIFPLRREETRCLIARSVIPQGLNAGYSGRKAFTLIELLVVVLIIGILAAVALPQYNKAVEKSRVTEALQAVHTIEKNIDLFLLENGGLPKNSTSCSEMEALASLAYNTSYFSFNPCDCAADGCTLQVWPQYNDWALGIFKGQAADAWGHWCWTRLTEQGRSFCASLKSLGWIYMDADF